MLASLTQDLLDLHVATTNAGRTLLANIPIAGCCSSSSCCCAKGGKSGN